MANMEFQKTTRLLKTRIAKRLEKSTLMVLEIRIVLHGQSQVKCWPAILDREILNRSTRSWLVTTMVGLSPKALFFVQTYMKILAKYIRFLPMTVFIISLILLQNLTMMRAWPFLAGLN